MDEHLWFALSLDYSCFISEKLAMRWKVEQEVQSASYQNNREKKNIVTWIEWLLVEQLRSG